MTVYIVIHFDGTDDSVVLVCADKGTAEAIAEKMGSDGRVEEAVFITSEASE